MIIRLLKNILIPIKIHNSVLIYLILCILYGNIDIYLSIFFFVIIHELFHIMMAFLFHLSVRCIEIYPFGLCAYIEDFFYSDIYKEVLIVLAGPIFHILADFIFYISDISMFKDINRTLLLFNILPIYPLDGNKLIILLLSAIGDLKSAMIYSFKLSVLSLSVFSIFYLNMNTFIIILFLYYNQFKYYRFIKKYLLNIIIKNKKENKNIINNKIIYRRGYNNFYNINGYLYNQNQIFNILIKKMLN